MTFHSFVLTPLAILAISGGVEQAVLRPADATARSSRLVAKADKQSSTAATRQTVSLLKRKLHGKLTFNAKTGEISLQYDWSSKNQLSDFELSDNKPALTDGGLVVPPGATLKHLLSFQEVMINVPVFVPSMQGTLIKTSGGAVARVGGAHPDTMYLSDGKETKAMIRTSRTAERPSIDPPDAYDESSAIRIRRPQ